MRHSLIQSFLKSFVIFSAILGLILIFILTGGSDISSAKADKYDELIKTSSDWSPLHTIAEAERYLNIGKQGNATVLYLSVLHTLSDSTEPSAIEMKVKCCIGIGDIYFTDGNYGEALKAYLWGLGFSEKSPAEPYIASLYRKVASVYNIFREYDMKRDFEQKGLAKARQHKDTTELRLILNNLARGFVAAKDPINARRYLTSLDALGNTPSRSSQDLFFHDYTLAQVVRCEGKLDEALNRYKTLFDRWTKDSVDVKYACSVLNEIYWIYNEMPGKKDSAEIYLRKCIDLVKDNNLSLMFKDEIKRLAEVYKQKGNNAEAAKWELQYYELIDSVYVRDGTKSKLHNQQYLYDINKAETKIDMLWSEKRAHDEIIRKQRRLIFIILGGVVLATLIIWFIYRQNRKLAESYRSLYVLNNTLVDTNKGALIKQHMLEDENEELRKRLESTITHGSPSTEEKLIAASEFQSSQGKDKYSSSNLSSAQQRSLARKISEAMENNTCNYCDVDFSLSVLSEHVGSNVRYVSQVINDAFGKSFNSYVNDYRIRTACLRLRGQSEYENYSIKGIGESVGFRSHSAFVGVFKKITGMTPSVYRKLVIP